MLHTPNKYCKGKKTIFLTLKNAYFTIFLFNSLSGTEEEATDILNPSSVTQNGKGRNLMLTYMYVCSFALIPS